MQTQTITPGSKDYPMRSGGGFQTDFVYRYLDVNLNCGSKSLVDQLDFAYEQITSLCGIQVVDEGIIKDANKPKFWIYASYQGKPVTIDLLRPPQYEEWQLKVSSKLGLEKSELEELADKIFKRIAKPKAEREFDKHQLRIQY